MYTGPLIHVSEQVKCEVVLGYSGVFLIKFLDQCGLQAGFLHRMETLKNNSLTVESVRS